MRFIDRLNDKEINFLDNVFTGTANPAALSFNTVHTFTRATVNTHFKRGDNVCWSFTKDDRTAFYCLEVTVCNDQSL